MTIGSHLVFDTRIMQVRVLSGGPLWTLRSAADHYIDTVEVVGAAPTGSTILL